MITQKGEKHNIVKKTQTEKTIKCHLDIKNTVIKLLSHPFLSLYLLKDYILLRLLREFGRKK